MPSIRIWLHDNRVFTVQPAPRFEENMVRCYLLETIQDCKILHLLRYVLWFIVANKFLRSSIWQKSEFKAMILPLEDVDVSLTTSGNCDKNSLWEFQPPYFRLCSQMTSLDSLVSFVDLVECFLFLENQALWYDTIIVKKEVITYG